MFSPSIVIDADRLPSLGAFYYSTSGMIYVGGGYNASYDAYASVDMYDPSTDEWVLAHSSTTVAPMNEPRGDL